MSDFGRGHRDQTGAPYVYGALAAHILGYVGAPDDTNKEEARKFTFYQGDVDGKSNIESDGRLSARQTGRALSASKREGHNRRRVARRAAATGANVFLTIDARIQAITDEALRAVSHAGAVVVDPNNANILAMASCHHSIRTHYSEHQAKDWQALRKDEGDPLVNRASERASAGIDIQIDHIAAGLRKNLTNAHYIAEVVSVMASLFPVLGE